MDFRFRFFLDFFPARYLYALFSENEFILESLSGSPKDIRIKCLSVFLFIVMCFSCIFKFLVSSCPYLETDGRVGHTGMGNIAIFFLSFPFVCLLHDMDHLRVMRCGVTWMLVVFIVVLLSARVVTLCSGSFGIAILFDIWKVDPF